MTQSHTTGPRGARPRRIPFGTLLAAALIALLGWAGSALGQGVPGGPDLPPPDPTPAAPDPAPTPTPTPTPPSNPTPVTPVQPSTPQTQGNGPSAAELAAQRREQAARQAALARQRELERQRRQAALRAQHRREQRAREFKALDVWANAQSALAQDIQGSVEALDGVAVDAAVAATAQAGEPVSNDPAHGPALIVVLLIASGISALLVMLPVIAGRFSTARRVPVGGGRMDDQLIDRMTFVQAHRVELAGVSAGCLIIALLLYVGAI